MPRPMTMDSYQDHVQALASSYLHMEKKIFNILSPDLSTEERDGFVKIFKLLYLTSALNEETGEFAGKMKKLIRDHDWNLDTTYIEGLLKELGDCLWYITETARQLDCPLEGVASRNLLKLQDRVKRGTLHGDGDNR